MNFQNLVWLGIGLAGLLAVAQFLGKIVWKRLLLAGIFGSISFLILYLFKFSDYSLVQHPELFMGYIPASILLSTSFYLLVRTYAEDRDFTMADLLQLIPFGIAAIAYGIFLFVDPDTKSTLILALYQGKNTLVFLPFTLISAMISLVFLARTYRLDPRYYSFDFSRRQGVTGLVILTAMALIIAMSLGTISVPIAVVLAKWGSILFSAGLIMAAAIQIRHPDYFLGWITELKKNYQKRYYLNGIDIAETRSRLVELMETQKCYRDNELSLEKLADQLNITRYQLSQLLNTDIKISFNRFIQGYRVDAAKQLLVKYPHRTILSIAYEVGFNSNSAFQNAFKSIVGKTPSDYRNEANQVRL
ncbi:helix-turn-helix domain-containing protein [bacterium]|nr:helix-turn-helix domain-containing protein [bacterium]